MFADEFTTENGLVAWHSGPGAGVTLPDPAFPVCRCVAPSRHRPGMKGLFRAGWRNTYPTGLKRYYIESIGAGQAQWASFGRRMRGSGPFAGAGKSPLSNLGRRTGPAPERTALSTGHLNRVSTAQTDLFEAR
jgi:hypothetical protein